MVQAYDAGIPEMTSMVKVAIQVLGKWEKMPTIVLISESVIEYVCLILQT